jgi:archaellum component FlaF (FlaF/FlaG flagellin family)
VSFVVLNLKDASGKIISHNVYWLAADNDYKALNTMPRTQVKTTVLKSEQVKTETKWTVKFTNNSAKLAFFIRPQLMSDGEEVAPCFWSANYFSLAPGESITVTASVPASQLKSKNQEILLEGWNIDKQTFSLIDQKK